MSLYRNASVNPAHLIAVGPISTPNGLTPRSTGTPNILTLLLFEKFMVYLAYVVSVFPQRLPVSIFDGPFSTS
jgi:hypothetical protein